MTRFNYENAEHAAAVINLKSYIKALLSGADTRATYDAHAGQFANLTSTIIFQSFYETLQSGGTEEQLLTVIPKVILATHSHFDDQPAALENDPFLAEFRAENEQMLALFDEIRPLTTVARTAERDEQIVKILTGLTSYGAHFSRMQNILFPTLEREDRSFHALSLLWAWHDRCKESLRTALEVYADRSVPQSELNRVIGELFANYVSLPIKEERFLFPAAATTLKAEDWASMYDQARVYPVAFGIRAEEEIVYEQEETASGEFHSTTGSLSFEQLNMILRHLPVDFTVVDENDRVLYFSDSPHRIFPRSPAIIGREVKNCHPPKSLNVVEDIISAFREGRESHMRFWLEHHGRKLLIEYFCLRDDRRRYRGVLEVSQDITELSQLKGEQRLGSWLDR